MLRSLILGLALALAPLALNAQATTNCADGTTSTATGRGACSGHGGVGKKAAKATKSTTKSETKSAAKSEMKSTAKSDQKATTKAAASDTKAATKTAKAESKTTASPTDANGASAKCKDGTYSHAASRRGACSRHGGVSEWLKS